MGTGKSHLLKCGLVGDMLVPRRVHEKPPCNNNKETAGHGDCWLENQHVSIGEQGSINVFLVNITSSKMMSRYLKFIVLSGFSMFQHLFGLVYPPNFGELIQFDDICCNWEVKEETPHLQGKI